MHCLRAKLDSSPLISANSTTIVSFGLPPKLTAIGTIIGVLVVILLSQYQYRSLTKSLKALRVLTSDIECAFREAFAGSDDEFIIDMNHSRRQFRLSVAQCHLDYHDLSTTSWQTYPVALLRLRWHIRTAKKNGRALLTKIQKQDEGENRRRIVADVELANLRRRHA
ncbi:hypothetical protein C8J56DRAFT_1066812 [Mycena floridula]|nr:hypothetical protein C8J56DRAFT_1066812 [Mycena floridula]